MTTSRLTTLSALVCVAALSLTACGTDEEDPTPSSSGSPAVESTGAAPAPESADAALAAIATAEQEAGGTAYELDDQDDDGTWEVDVAVGDRSVEVTVSADGSEVVRTDDDGRLDGDDRRALDAATTGLVDAITTALAEVDGTLDDVELDDEGGTFAWEVSIDEQGGGDVEVYVDVTTGKVLRVDRG